MNLQSLEKLNSLLKQHEALLQKIKTIRDMDIEFGFIRRIDGHDHIHGKLRNEPKLTEHVVNFWHDEAYEIEKQLEALGFDVTSLEARCSPPPQPSAE
ncbi:hypothetical protein [Vibrio phage vB_VpS_BA3]|nr:hypothetical protein [Vibrio phage vB_VpS_BA3]